MTNSDRLQEIRERAEKATPGPWETSPIMRPYWTSICLPNHPVIPGLVIADARPKEAEFIAASREDIPWLLQLVTEQQREIDRYRRALEAVNEFAKEDNICTHQTIGAQHGWGACFVCLIQATAQGALRGENGFFGEDE